MRRLQHQMMRVCDHRRFPLRGPAPEDKHDWLVPLLQNADRGVRELFPADIPMGIGLVGADRQNRIQEQHTLFCPLDKTAVIRYFTSEIVVQFLVNIHQRRLNLYTRLH